MPWSRDLVTVGPSNGDTIAVAVCVSLAGVGIVAIAVHIIRMYRRQQNLQDAQDTLPRPFDATVPAATMTNTSMITYGLTSLPMLKSSPARERGRRSRYEARREAIPARIGSLGGGTAPIPTAATPSQSKPGSTHMHPRLSDTSLRSTHAGPSTYHTPPRSSRWTHPHTPIPPDPPSQSGSRAQHAQLPPSLPTGTNLQRTSGAPVTRSASVEERRSAKHALWLSRSASELYRAASSVPRYRVPEYGSHASSSRYANRHGGYESHVDSPTNHLRQSHSASPMVHVHRVGSGPEEDVGGTIIFQHQDAGVMQELPPPYHKLVRSGGEV